MVSDKLTRVSEKSMTFDGVMTNPEIQRHYKFNFAVGSLDGSFFGFALGLASYVTILPLFVSNLTDSTILIGLIATIHTLGWQLPQLFTSNRVSRLTHIKPMVIWMTIHERLPYLGLALIAFFLPNLNNNFALFLIVIVLMWQSFGGGFTATAWQSMISKVIPLKRRGTFYGFQSSAANLMGSIGAVLAGLILAAMVFPMNFATLFFIAGISMLVSMAFLMMTREPDIPLEPIKVKSQHENFRTKLGQILKSDENFRWFLMARMVSQLYLYT
jgi:MFS family permease